MRAFSLMLLAGEVDRACREVALEDGLERAVLEEDLERRELVEKGGEGC